VLLVSPPFSNVADKFPPPTTLENRQWTSEQKIGGGVHLTSGPPVEGLRKLVNVWTMLRVRLEAAINGRGELDWQAAVVAHRFRPACELLVVPVIASMKRFAAGGGLEQHHADSPDIGRRGNQIPTSLFGG